MLFLFLRNFSYQKFWMKFNSSFFLTEKKNSDTIFRMKGKKLIMLTFTSLVIKNCATKNSNCYPKKQNVNRIITKIMSRKKKKSPIS